MTYLHSFDGWMIRFLRLLDLRVSGYLLCFFRRENSFISWEREGEKRSDINDKHFSLSLPLVCTCASSLTFGHNSCEINLELLILNEICNPFISHQVDDVSSIVFRYQQQSDWSSSGWMNASNTIRPRDSSSSTSRFTPNTSKWMHAMLILLSSSSSSSCWISSPRKTFPMWRFNMCVKTRCYFLNVPIGMKQFKSSVPCTAEHHREYVIRITILAFGTKHAQILNNQNIKQNSGESREKRIDSLIIQF